jgi:RNA recognition motif-containing protein
MSKNFKKEMKIVISNLGKKISSEDIRKLFKDCGEIKYIIYNINMVGK